MRGGPGPESPARSAAASSAALREAVGGHLGQGTAESALHARRDRVTHPADCGHRIRDPLCGDHLRGWAGERGLAREHLVEHASERINVGAGIEVALPAGLFGAHVCRGAHDHPGLGKPVHRVLLDGAGDSEIGHQRVVLPGQQDVPRLDVPVHDAVAVSAVERVGDLAGEAHRLVDRQLPLAVEPGAERFSLDEGHGEPEQRSGPARVEDGEDVGVLQPGGELNLPLEPFGPECHRQVGAQQLERHAPAMSQILDEVHRRHTAVAKLPLYLIGGTEIGLKPL